MVCERMVLFGELTLNGLNGRVLRENGTVLVGNGTIWYKMGTNDLGVDFKFCISDIFGAFYLYIESA